ncbi:hypothetical protein [Roseibium aggregatum]|uniref:hypothetical protein n=1 Tax=Roseibium aggregatum TaxID=187304 RepID=UPI001E349417|nr:hypothetical protein [Roseibium aggregatum]
MLARSGFFLARLAGFPLDPDQVFARQPPELSGYSGFAAGRQMRLPSVFAHRAPGLTALGAPHPDLAAAVPSTAACCVPQGPRLINQIGSNIQYKIFEIIFASPIKGDPVKDGFRENWSYETENDGYFRDCFGIVDCVRRAAESHYRGPA